MPDPASTIRRRVLLGGAAALGVAALTGVATPTGRRELFTLGVASGDPLPDAVVLWTRLAPDPLAPDGLGGMAAAPVPVGWQVAADESFSQVVRSGTTVAQGEQAHSVHVEVAGLRPGSEYFYRFRAGNELSPVGRTKTAPPPGARLDRFAFAFASCQHYADGFYNAYAHLARQDFDLVVFLGDYIYEGGSQGSIGRGHRPARDVRTLADYRVRFAQYKTDTDLQAAHAAFPWVAVFDDHEVENNWAGDHSESGIPPAQFRERRAHAFQAYYEHLPLRAAQRPAGPAMTIHRRLTFGDLVDLHVLDTRQHRSVQVPDAQRDDPGRTMLGAAQKAWLFRNLSGPTARWNVLAQQVFFSQLNPASGAQTRSDDAWDDYEAERDEVRDHLARTRNPVIITGDAHANFVSDVKADFAVPASATVATELIGTSITSEGDGVDHTPGDLAQLRANPHLRFVNRQRGYVANLVAPGEWAATYRVVERVSRPGSPVHDRAGFVVADARPGARFR
ncbi:alkaline phosphatase D family protein [Amycolatopsis acidiphila]|uniref:Alkaline phosphatase n=1 Tax=Amycolatopsis acidiphila TaxID=715473 RepID=A0A558ACM9_9PSEU|nr:alkaline phosphatase D family protein [Amycolatopsis acidiphila]TVT22026.1 alkaline phosphatase [Amycolatopsis acidiphila]UIJ63655.1 alkaline phosphatase D family protein [Amycolatopsis acidiphila]GHG67649.1 alkaline phosphatase D [Amycolatopsis acidiphila]